MKIVRKLFINSRNQQASVTIPKKILEELQKASKNDKLPKKIFMEINIDGKYKK